MFIASVHSMDMGGKIRSWGVLNSLRRRNFVSDLGNVARARSAPDQNMTVNVAHNTIVAALRVRRSRLLRVQLHPIMDSLSERMEQIVIENDHDTDRSRREERARSYAYVSGSVLEKLVSVVKLE